MSKYYYLVAGLPELTLEDSKLSYTVADFKTEIYPGLSSSDQKLIDLFYLKFDNANVLKLLKDKDAVIDLRGNFSAAAKILQLSGGYVAVKSALKNFLLTYPFLFPIISIHQPKVRCSTKTIWQPCIMSMP